VTATITLDTTPEIRIAQVPQANVANVTTAILISAGISCASALKMGFQKQPMTVGL